MSQRIYVLSIGDGAQKIGISDDPIGRLAMLQTGNPYRMTVILSLEVDNALMVERAVHKELARFRIHGEWFAVTPIAAVQMVSAKIIQCSHPSYADIKLQFGAFGVVDDFTARAFEFAKCNPDIFPSDVQ